jgi:hypothetical protein
VLIPIRGTANSDAREAGLGREFIEEMSDGVCAMLGKRVRTEGESFVSALQQDINLCAVDGASAMGQSLFVGVVFFRPDHWFAASPSLCKSLRIVSRLPRTAEAGSAADPFSSPNQPLQFGALATVNYASVLHMPALSIWYVPVRRHLQMQIGDTVVVGPKRVENIFHHVYEDHYPEPSQLNQDRSTP